MQFGKVQAKKFGTAYGAYSVVTDREYYDSQITLTDYEADLIIGHFGRSQFHVGNVSSNPTLSKKKFFLYPNGNPVNLNVVFPKPEKTELRLYISLRAGFKPKGDQVWFMYKKNGEIWIGALDEKNWRSEASEFRKDEYEDFYQNAVNESDTIKIARLRERDAYARDRKIAVKRMKLSAFHCEYDNTHKLFISRFNRRPYLEAHHLIPMGMQCEFKKSLDSINNVYCLCPYCHRAVHHANEVLARDILETLALVLKQYKLSTIDLLSFYGVEIIE